MMESTSIPEAETTIVTNNSGSFHTQRDAWIGNSYHAAVQNFNFAGDFADLPQDIQRRLNPHRGVLTTGTPEQKREFALNVLYYEGYDAKRHQIASVNTTAESYAWIETTVWPRWLESTNDNPLWIAGLPGSGKSTLMKYLNEHKSTRQRLSLADPDKSWYLIYFFFDYRGGSGLQNNIQGLLRMFLRQLVSQIPSIADALSTLVSELDTSSISDCVDSLCRIVSERSLDICAFIDGLDEYEGDPWDLYALAQALRDRAAFKLCFASRPEPAFLSIFKELSAETVNVQDYNFSAIRACVDFKIKKLQIEHFSLTDHFPSSLRNKLVERAQGIILWASLVVDEIVKEMVGCRNPSLLPIEDILDSVPAGLEALYDRILSKIAPDMADGAALFLHLIINDESDNLFSTLVTLVPAWTYIQCVCRRVPPSLGEDGPESFNAKVMAFIGNLVSVAWNDGMADANVRLVHKSFSKYMSKSLWVKQNLDPDVRRLFWSCPWGTLGLHLMQHNPDLLESVLAELQPFFGTSRVIDFSDNEKITDICALELQHFDYMFLRVLHYFGAFIGKPVAVEYATDGEISFPHVPRHASVLHFGMCRECGYYLRIGHDPVRGRIWQMLQDGHVDLYCSFVHRSPLAVIERKVLAYQDEFGTSAVSRFFDIVLFVANSPGSRPLMDKCLKVMPRLVELGAGFRTAHLCGVAVLKTMGRENKINEQMDGVQVIDPSANTHDEWCVRPSDEEDDSIAHHWLSSHPRNREVSEEFLCALIHGGLDIQQCFHREGSVFHAILTRLWKHRNALNRQRAQVAMLDHFCVAANCFQPPQHIRGKNLASKLASALHKKASLSLVTTIHWERRADIRTLVKIFALMRKALEEAERTGKWGPTLEYMKGEDVSVMLL